MLGFNYWRIVVYDMTDEFFRKVIDELVDFGQYDPELKDGMRWLDLQAQKEGVSFYDKVYEVLYKHDTNSKARKWLHDRNNS